MKIQKEWLDFLREQYPAGSRIRLREMGADDPCPIKPGSMGTLQCIDDQGTFHVTWDDGRGLGLVIGQDSFTVLPPPLQTLKLYMPLTVGYFVNEDGCGWGNEEYTMEAGEAVQYAPQITAVLERERRRFIHYGEIHGMEEPERGLMAVYGKNDSVDRKVYSYWLTTEVRDNQLWGVAECRVRDKLTAEELDQLKEDIAGQAADGFGESLEQCEIQISDGRELRAHLWRTGDWSIQTEQERFGPKLAESLPEMCFSVLPDTGDLICIKRGESGYYRSDWNTSDRIKNQEIAKNANESLGITEAQRKAMEAGSMFGWSCPGADPKSYEQDQPQQGGMDLA